MFPVLSIVTFLPLIGAGFIFFINGEDEVVNRNARNVALWTSVVTFALSLFIWADFKPGVAGFQMQERLEWLSSFGMSYHMGVDGVSVLFVLLSTLLTPLCILASWTTVTKNVREYMAAFLVLETMMIGMFCALDFVLFYIFFEAVLIPMFLIIGVWGGKRRIYASYKFFLYTLLGSVLMLVALVTFARIGGTTNIPALMGVEVPSHLQNWLWLALFASFAVKVPMWPVHTWLPDAHVEAPTAGSVILAGVLLKMGGYGFIRFSLPLLPEATAYFAPFVFTLSVVAVIYTSLVALVQTDMKKLIAYSSIAHMAFVTIGIFTVTEEGVAGAIFQMLSHGVVSAALFLCVGVVYDRMHTREIAKYGGVARVMPKFATLFMLFTLASVGLPGTSGFVGEFLSLVGAFKVNTTVAFFAATGLVLGAAYMLYLYKRVAFGDVKSPDVAAMPDLDWRETTSLVALGIVALWMGITPSVFLDKMAASVTHIVDLSAVETVAEKADHSEDHGGGH